MWDASARLDSAWSSWLWFVRQFARAGPNRRPQSPNHLAKQDRQPRPTRQHKRPCEPARRTVMIRANRKTRTSKIVAQRHLAIGLRSARQSSTPNEHAVKIRTRHAANTPPTSSPRPPQTSDPLSIRPANRDHSLPIVGTHRSKTLLTPTPTPAFLNREFEHRLVQPTGHS